MANSVMFDPPPSTYNHDDLFPGDIDPLAIPPLDHTDLSFLDNSLDCHIDPDFNIDDLDFDDILFDVGPASNSESADHDSSLSQLPCVNFDQFSSIWPLQAEGLDSRFANQVPNVDVATNHGTDRSSDAPMVVGSEFDHNDRDSSGHVSSGDSRTGGCNLSEGSDSQKLNHPSPESGSCDQIGTYVGSKSISKRKKEQQEEGTAENRIRKFRKSSTDTYVGVEDEEDDKKKARLIRNRESAHLSRQRKKQYVEELEDKVRSMHSTITELNTRISYIMAENVTLKQQLSGGGMYPPPGVYPMTPMGYPWMPCPPYAVKQGSKVPLIPIPRLNPQQPAKAPKVSKKSDKSEKKKSQEKTKKLASISFLGLLFFMLLFGGLVPIINVRYGGIGGKNSVVDKFSDLHRGRTLMVDDGGMCYRDGKCGHEHVRHQEKHFRRIPVEEEKVLQLNVNSNGSVVVGNSSESLFASLFVPRNDKLVQIDGNLIIHSVLASEKAAIESRAVVQMKTSEETRLAIARNYLPTYQVAGAGRSNGRSSELDRDHTGRQKALGSGSADDLKTPAPQWFLEDLAGPLLSSGICTEVFQFDVSPSPGSVVPATSMTTNITSEYRQNSTRLKSSRRILRGHSVPLNGRDYNITDKGAGGIKGNKPSSPSIVVSVVIDPREVSEVESEGMMRYKSLSRIFVVVLIDSVKYVTYSCMLPLIGSSPHHMVTA